MRQIKVVLILGILACYASGYLSLSIAIAEACDQPARIVSAQAGVEVQRKGESKWTPVKIDAILCPEDTIRVLNRATLLLPNGTTYTFGCNTWFTFPATEKNQPLLLKLLSGAVHIFSREPRRLTVDTPFVAGTVEGTEFFVKVENDYTLVSVFEGYVNVNNDRGSLTLKSGEVAIARKEQAPMRHIVIRPRDAVHWTLYYPPIFNFHPDDFQAGASSSRL